MARAIRNLRRLFGVGWTLARHGALFPLERQGYSRALALVARLARPMRKRRFAARRPGERLAAALTALGPSYVKFGQSLATRSDLIGDALAEDLSRLQDGLAPFPAERARATVEAGLGGKVADFFAAFDDAPLAAASIAQVHRATVPGGGKVAVKVLRPGIEASFARDIELFRWAAGVLERAIPRTRRLRPSEAVALFAETVAVELDMRMEAAAVAELAENFRDDPDFKVPAVDWRRTTRRALTIERVEGRRIDDLEGLRADGHDPTEVLRKSARVFFNQVFRDGFFHADTHPGNLFVLPDGRIAPVDFGIMGRLDEETRLYLADMLTGFLARDYRRVAAVQFRAGYVPRHKSLDAFAQACRSIGEPILDLPLADISLARLLAQLFRVTERFEMPVQPELLLLQKTMLVAEGVGRRIDNRANVWELARPLIERWTIENRSPAARARRAAVEAGDLAQRLPALVVRAERALADFGDGGARPRPDAPPRAAGDGASGRGGAVLPWLVALALAAALGAALAAG